VKCEAGYLVRRAAEQFGNRTALTFNGSNFSFVEINCKANRLGSALRRLGLNIGDRVGVLAYNSPELLTCWFGCEKFGLVRTVLHSHIEFRAQVKLLNQIGAAALIFDARFAPQLEEHRAGLVTVRHLIAIGDVCPSWASSFEEIEKLGSAEDPRLDIDEDAPCFLQLTSGTTGDPKPWIKTYRSWLSVILQNVIHFDSFGNAPRISSEDVNLHVHALQSSSGFKTLYPYFIRGARTVIQNDQIFDAAKVVDLLVVEKVTGTLLHGRMLPALLEAAEARRDAKFSLQRVVVSLATPELLTRMTDVFGPVWCHSYGSTELGSVITRLLATDVDPPSKRMSSLGRVAAPLVEIAIVDPSGRRVPANVPGEIVTRGPMSQGGYWGAQPDRKDALAEQDWFKSGDIGYLDEDGFLFLEDRALDVIRLPGDIAVYPHRVEKALLAHHGVANCGVVADPSRGQTEVVGVVQLKQGLEPSDNLELEIISVAASHLSEHERPKRLIFMEELPTVHGGAKIRRGALRKLLEERQ